MKKKFDIKKWHKNFERWARDPSNQTFLHDDPKKEVHDYLASTKFELHIATNLDYLAAWEAGQGSCRVCSGEEGGWQAIQGSFRYRTWQHRIIAALQDAKQFLGSANVVFLPLLLCHAVAFREDAFADWLGRRMIADLTEKTGKYSNWEGARFEPFALKLFGLWRGVSVDFHATPVKSIGVYQEVLDDWDNDKRLKELFPKILDHHWELTELTGKEPASFDRAPYSVMPVEIFAIRRIRNEMGLEMPEFDHPLMQTPLATPPARLPEFRDDLLDQVIARARKELPIGDPW